MSYVEIPISIQPKLSGGRFHTVVINDDEVRITTCQNLYGNQESETLLTVPIQSITEVENLPSKFGLFGGRCRIAYFGDFGQAKQIDLKALDAKYMVNNELTETIAKLLIGIKNGQNGLPPSPWIVTLPKHKSTRKLTFGLFLFADTLILYALIKKDAGFLLFFGTFLLCISLAALSIDYFTFNTAWHPGFKILASVVIFCIAFILLGITLTLYELYGFL